MKLHTMILEYCNMLIINIITFLLAYTQRDKLYFFERPASSRNNFLSKLPILLAGCSWVYMLMNRDLILSNIDVLPVFSAFTVFEQLRNTGITFALFGRQTTGVLISTSLYALDGYFIGARFPAYALFGLVRALSYRNLSLAESITYSLSLLLCGYVM